MCSTRCNSLLAARQHIHQVNAEASIKYRRKSEVWIWCRSDMERAVNDAARYRQRADEAEKAAEPLQKRIRDLQAELDNQSDESRVVCDRAHA